MEVPSKIALLVIIIGAITLVSIYFFYVKIRPLIVETNYPEPIWATAYGKITLTKDFIESGFTKPSRIFLFIPSNPKFLCSRSIVLKNIANINWIDNTTGEYLVSFQLPIPMEIYVTPDCGGCGHEPVSIDSNGVKKEVNIIWNSSRCEESSISISDNLNEILKEANIRLSGLKSDILSKDRGLTREQIDSIEKGNIHDGFELISEANYPRPLNESLLSAYYSLWYSWKGYVEEDNYRLINCVNMTQKIINSHNNSLCYMLEPSTNQTFMLHNQYANNWYYRNDNPRHYDTIESIKKNLNTVYNEHSLMIEIAGECEQNLRIINQTFEFQASYCETKENLISFFNYSASILLLAIILSIGFILGRWTDKGKEMMEKVVKHDRKKS